MAPRRSQDLDGHPDARPGRHRGHPPDPSAPATCDRVPGIGDLIWREREVVALIAAALSNGEIARKL